MKRSTLLRSLLGKGEVPIMPAIGAPDQAQLCEKLGFTTVLVSGASVSTQILGLPDVGLMTMTELAKAVENICTTSNICAMVDCDTGFGNAINVRRTTGAMIRAGAAGLFIEDQVSPKRCAFVKGKTVLSLEEAAGKYRAAVDVRNELDPDFIIMARTDARTAVGGSVEEVIRRGRAYIEAGADMLYVAGLQSRDEIRRLRAELKDCLKLLAGSWNAIDPPLTQKEAEDFGLCMVHCNLRSPYCVALYDYLSGYRKGGLDFENEFKKKTANHPMGGGDLSMGVFDLSGLPQVAEWEKRYLPTETLERYEQSIGLYDPRKRGKD